MPAKKNISLCADAVWQTLCLIYEGDPRIRDSNVDPHVDMPVSEVMSILMTVMANFLANIPDAKDRARIVGMIAPRLEKAIEQARDHRRRSETPLWMPDRHIIQ